MDQSKASNLNRNFETALKDMLRSVEAPLQGPQREHFAADSARAFELSPTSNPSAKDSFSLPTFRKVFSGP